jgi:magnesium-transporting ATPase (P-type)
VDRGGHKVVVMGSGTGPAKEVSSILVTDKGFDSMAAGIEEGRFVFDNLRKIIYVLILVLVVIASLLTIGLALVTDTHLFCLCIITKNKVSL